MGHSQIRAISPKSVLRHSALQAEKIGNTAKLVQLKLNIPISLESPSRLGWTLLRQKSENRGKCKKKINKLLYLKVFESSIVSKRL